MLKMTKNLLITKNTAIKHCDRFYRVLLHASDCYDGFVKPCLSKSNYVYNFRLHYF